MGTAENYASYMHLANFNPKGKVMFQDNDCVRTGGKGNLALTELKLEMIHGTEKDVITSKKPICFHT